MLLKPVEMLAAGDVRLYTMTKSIKLTVQFMAALVAVLTLTSCRTADSNENTGYRPAGSGGRGMSPGMESETNTAERR